MSVVKEVLGLKKTKKRKSWSLGETEISLQHSKLFFTVSKKRNYKLPVKWGRNLIRKADALMQGVKNHNKCISALIETDVWKQNYNTEDV